jgi:hypothetical protein
MLEVPLNGKSIGPLTVPPVVKLDMRNDPAAAVWFRDAIHHKHI